VPCACCGENEAAGFTVEHYDDGFAFVHLNDQGVFDLDLFPETNPATNRAGCYMIVPDVDTWHQRLVAAGLQVTAGEDQPGGCMSSRSPTRTASTSGSG